jgi:hypothetical protein
VRGAGDETGVMQMKGCEWGGAKLWIECDKTAAASGMRLVDRTGSVSRLGLRVMLRAASKMGGSCVWKTGIKQKNCEWDGAGGWNASVIRAG